MSEDNGGGNTFLGVILGALLIAVVALSFMVLNGGIDRQAADISIAAPAVPDSG